MWKWYLLISTADFIGRGGEREREQGVVWKYLKFFKLERDNSNETLAIDRAKYYKYGAQFYYSLKKEVSG